LEVDEPIKQDLIKSLETGNVENTIRDVGRIKTDINVRVWKTTNTQFTEPSNNKDNLDVASRWAKINVDLGKTLIAYNTELKNRETVYTTLKNKADQMKLESILMEKSTIRSYTDWIEKAKEAGIDDVNKISEMDANFAYSPSNIEQARIILNTVGANLKEYLVDKKVPTVFSSAVSDYRKPETGTPEEILKAHSEKLSEEITFLHQEQRAANQSLTTIGQLPNNSTYMDPIIMPVQPNSTQTNFNTLNNIQIDNFFLGCANNCIYKRALYIQEDLKLESPIKNGNMEAMVKNLIQVPLLTQAIVQPLPLPVFDKGVEAYNASMSNIYTTIEKGLGSSTLSDIPIVEPWGNQYNTKEVQINFRPSQTTEFPADFYLQEANSNISKIHDTILVSPENIILPKQSIIGQTTAFVNQSQNISVTPNENTSTAEQEMTSLENSVTSNASSGHMSPSYIVYYYKTFKETISDWIKQISSLWIFESSEYTEKYEKVVSQYKILSTWANSAEKGADNQKYKNYNTLLRELAFTIETSEDHDQLWSNFRKALTQEQSNTIDMMFVDYQSDLENLIQGLKYDGGDSFVEILTGDKNVKVNSLASTVSNYITQEELKNQNVEVKPRNVAYELMKYFVSDRKMTLDDAMYQTANNAGQSFSHLTDHIDQLIELEKTQYETGTGDPVLSYMLMMVSLRCGAIPDQCSQLKGDLMPDVTSLLWTAYMNGDITRDYPITNTTDSTPITRSKESPFVSTMKIASGNNYFKVSQSDYIQKLNPSTVKALMLGSNNKVRYYHDRYIARVGALSQEKFVEKINNPETDKAIQDITYNLLGINMPYNFKENLITASKLLGLFQNTPIIKKDEIIQIAQENRSVVKNTIKNVKYNALVALDKFKNDSAQEAEKLQNVLYFDSINFGTSLYLSWSHFYHDSTPTDSRMVQYADTMMKSITLAGNSAMGILDVLTAGHSTRAIDTYFPFSSGGYNKLDTYL
jgi:hypothetical protein